jgi:hypothetical protein
MCQEQLKSYSPVRCLELMNEAHLDIMGRCGLVPEGTLDIFLTANQQEYALDDSVVNIDDAVYWSSASSHFPLRPTNKDSLYEDYGPNWEVNISPGQPYAFYEMGGMIGFVPAPSITTSNGYPKVTLYVRQFTPLTLTGNFPTTINTVEPYVLHVLRYYAMKETPEKLPMFDALYKDKVKSIQDYVWRRTKRDKPRVFMRIPKIGGGI